MLWVALHFPSLAPGTLEAIAAWACQFTPKVSLEPPQDLLLEVEGSLRLFGGLQPLLQKIRSGSEAIGVRASTASAPTARAALWLSRHGHANLEETPVDVACGGEPLAFLRSIGIATVGELMRLPREGLARRCGQRLLDELDRALGAAPEPRAFFAPPPRFAAQLELPASVMHAEALLFAARRLLVQLEGLLTARQAGLREFTLILLHSHSTSSAIHVALASPAREAERLAQLLREKLSATSLVRPVEAIRLEAEDFAPLHGRSGGLFGDPGGEAEGWARLLERLRARLGHEAVSGLAVHPDHRPEHAWRRVEPGEWDPHDFRQPGPRPLWLVERKKLRESQFVLLVGPERIESGWWDGDEAGRDYFIAQLDDASLAWLYRDKEGWFLHGLFA